MKEMFFCQGAGQILSVHCGGASQGDSGGERGLQVDRGVAVITHKRLRYYFFGIIVAAKKVHFADAIQ